MCISLGDLSGIVDEELEGFIEGVRAEFGEVSGFWVLDAEEAIAAQRLYCLPQRPQRAQRKGTSEHDG